MPSDYEAIRKANIDRYGWDSSYHALISDRLYPDQTHFIFELLQNAEDVRATWVEFAILCDRLEVRHNGKRLFTEEDVRSICSIGQSTKQEDLTQIGKFGIGFKSVYGFTSSPEVHSGDEHFRIRHYIRPEGTAPAFVEAGQTLFVLPFDAAAKLSSAKAYQIILAGLQSLQPRMLLFLKHIDCVRWIAEDGSEGSCQRLITKTKIHGAKLVAVSKGDTEAEAESWLVFERFLHEEVFKELSVSIAFHLARRPGRRSQIAALRTSPLVCFFPTEKETNLGFLIQGPYRTTPARDNVPSHDPANRRLVEETASLMKQAYLAIRDGGLLDVNALESLPLDKNRFPEDRLFRPFFDAARELLAKEKLLPVRLTKKAGPVQPAFVRPGNAVVGSNSMLCDLVPDRYLRSLCGTTEPLHWLSVSFCERPALIEYLRSEFGVEEITPDKLAQLLTKEFLEQRSDTWIVNLYRFLNHHQSLWRRERPLHAPPPLRDKEILRLESKKHVRQFDDLGKPTAYLPQGTAIDFDLPVIRRAVVKDKGALAFLQALGLEAPKLLDEVRARVLSKYQKENGPLEVSADVHRCDWEKILAVYEDSHSKDQRELVRQLREIRCVRSRDVSRERLYYVRPAQAYLRSREMELFLGDSDSVRFVAEEYDARILALLKEVGIQVKLAVKQRPPGWDGHVQLESQHSHHGRGLNGFDPDFSIDGLDDAVATPTIARSAYIWKHICAPHYRQIRGRVEWSSRSNFGRGGRYYQCEEVCSKAGESLTNRAWLPNRAGHFYRPQELTLDDLPEEFDRFEAVANALGMKQARSIIELERTEQRKRAAETLGIDTETAEVLRELRDAGVSGDEANAALRGLVKQKRDQQTVSTETASRVSFRESLEQRFGRSERLLRTQTNFGSNPVRSPEYRRAQAAKEIHEEREGEPAPEERYRYAERRVWESRDPQTRTFLAEEYGGFCQICGDSNAFQRLDGLPYFEAKYIVEASMARWIERPGNCLSLCATCCAKLTHGSVQSVEFIQKILALLLAGEGGSGELSIEFLLCGEPVTLRFTERHLLDLQELLREDGEKTGQE
jgi:hypothetical protein